MKVSEIGEFGLIRRLTEVLGVEYPPVKGRPQHGFRVGIGDDAVVSRRHDGFLIWTTDTLVEGVHFTPGRTAWADVGWKAMAVNLSDIGAMGGRPDLALVTLMLPPEFEVEDAVELYRGMKEAADSFGATIGGGDIVRAPYFAVTVAQAGWATVSSTGEALVMTRDTARKGDIVAVSGRLGDSAGGVRLIAGDSPTVGDAERALKLAQERPQPRVALGQAAVKAGVRCAIDVSDGLVQDLGHIARASGVYVHIDANRVPMSTALTEVFPAQAMGLALSGGEDYELILIAPAVVMEALIRDGAEITEIGQVMHDEEARVVVVDEAGQEIPIGRGGWDHLG